MTAEAFRISLGDLRRHSGERKEIEARGSLDELQTLGAAINPDSDIKFVGTIEAIEGRRVAAKGTVVAHWFGECRRCLGPADDEITKDVSEIYEPDATEGETYELGNDSVDLEPMIREALMLEIPTAPVCRPDCPGLCPVCGINRDSQACDCKVETTDPRWAALDQLKDSPESQ